MNDPPFETNVSGRPVIGSRMGGIPEILEDDGTGWLFPAGDVQALADRLLRWAELGSEREEYGRRAWQDARTRFHPTRVLETTIGYYRRLLGK